MAQILAPRLARGQRRLGLRNDRVGEGVGDAVLVDRDQRHRAGARGVAQPRRDARLRQAEAPGPALHRLDQLAVARLHRRPPRDVPLAVGLLVDGKDAAPLPVRAEDAEHPVWRRPDAADQARLMAVVRALHRLRAGEDAVARPQRRVARLCHDQEARRGSDPGPFQRAGEEVAVRIGRLHLQDGDRGQVLGVARAARAGGHGALRLHLAQHAFELDAKRAAVDAEGARDLALRRAGRVLRKPSCDLRPGGELFHPRALPWARGRRHPQRRDAVSRAARRLSPLQAPSRAGRRGRCRPLPA